MPNLLAQKFLLLKLKTKDPEAFGQFYDIYVKKIYRFIYFKVSSKEEAEDLTAEAFLKIWEYIFAGKKVDNLNAFTYQVARNLVIDFYRQKSQKTIALESEEILAEIPDPTAGAEKIAELWLDQEELAKYLKQLKDEYREIIILKYLDELSVSEIAKVLDKTNGNVRVLAHRALTTLKNLAEKNHRHE
ncbi:MAG: RNA polymerase sigma factor [Patescibacteria group bacterium]|jgi:RNA polymerase sigma-70 factor (ECF subfamily)